MPPTSIGDFSGPQQFLFCTIHKGICIPMHYHIKTLNSIHILANLCLSLSEPLPSSRHYMTQKLFTLVGIIV